jgi:hypothetical protein
MGSGAETHVYKIYFRWRVSEMVKNETVRSRFDRDGLQSRKIPCRIQSGHVAGDLDPSDSIGFDVPEASRQKLHELFISRANALGFPVVWIAGGGVAGEKLIECADLHP